MKSAIYRILKKVFIKQLITRLQSHNLQILIITRVNQTVDIPKMDEKQEKKFYNSLYAAITEAMVDILKKI